jgi:hypothetical protein
MSDKPSDDSLFYARAMAALSLQILANLNPATAARHVTDGYHDNGIDAIYHDTNRNRLHVVQSKASAKGGWSADDVSSIQRGITDLIHERYERFNSRVQNLKTHISTALEDPNIKLVICTASLHTQGPSPDTQRVLDDYLATLNDSSDTAEHALLLQGQFHRFVASDGQLPPISVIASILDWGRHESPLLAYYGRIAASTVAQWHSDHGSRLFSQNLRQIIDKSEINEEIARTLRDTPEFFWCLNNGITALADNVKKTLQGGDSRQIGHFQCDGLSIVNGAQTVGAIARAAQQAPDKVANATVGIRVISLANCPEDFARTITRTTNRQNNIERQDFAALDPEQERLRLDLRMEGREYAIRTGEPQPRPDAGCTLTEATVALACASTDLNLAVQAKREIGRLWDDTPGSHYRKIFNSSLSATRLWNSVLVLREVDIALNELQMKHRYSNQRLVLIHGNRFILHHVFRSIHDESVDLDSTDLNADQLKGLASTKCASPIADLAVSAYNTMFSWSYPASLFKNIDKCRQLSQQMKALISAPPGGLFG